MNNDVFRSKNDVFGAKMAIQEESKKCKKCQGYTHPSPRGPRRHPPKSEASPTQVRSGSPAGIRPLDGTSGCH